MCDVSLTYLWHTCYVCTAHAWRTMRYCDERVSLLWCFILKCDVPTAFLPGLSRATVFFEPQVKIPSKPTSSHCVPSDHATIVLRTCHVTFDRATYLLRYFRSHGVRVTHVWMVNRSCYDTECGDFFKQV